MTAFADKSVRKKTQAAKWVRHICLRPLSRLNYDTKNYAIVMSLSPWATVPSAVGLIET